MFEKKPPTPPPKKKNGDWDLKHGDFQNMSQIKLKMQIIFVMVFLNLLVVSVVLLLLLLFGSGEKILVPCLDVIMVPFF